MIKKMGDNSAVSRFKDPFIPVNRKSERTYVYLCWIYMWCGTLWQQEKKEQLFRTNQLLQVISKCKAKAVCLPDTEIFYMIIDTCYKYGMFKMTKRVYDAMRLCRILPSNAIFQCYFQHQKKEQKISRSKDAMKANAPGARKEPKTKKNRDDN
jgi:pentatricopeptide repeat protein